MHLPYAHEKLFTAGTGYDGSLATELKNVPLPDLCQLGGWKTSRTVLERYRRPDPDTRWQASQGVVECCRQRLCWCP